MVCVSASVNLPLHHKVKKFSSGTGLPGWSRKKGRKTVVVCLCLALVDFVFLLKPCLQSRTHILINCKQAELVSTQRLELNYST